MCTRRDMKKSPAAYLLIVSKGHEKKPSRLPARREQTHNLLHSFKIHTITSYLFYKIKPILPFFCTSPIILPYKFWTLDFSIFICYTG